MTNPPTVSDVAELARMIAADGIEPHVLAIARLAELAGAVGLYPGAVAVLTDGESSMVTYARALLLLTRNWSQIRAAWCADNTFEEAFQRLLEQWRQHEDLRQPTEIASLFESRTLLDALRYEATSARTCLQPG